MRTRFNLLHQLRWVRTLPIHRFRVGLPISVGNVRRILMGFPRQGSQYQGMGRYLAQQYSSFNAIITDAANKASVLTGSILPFLVDKSAPRGLSIDQSGFASLFSVLYMHLVGKSRHPCPLP